MSILLLVNSLTSMNHAHQNPSNNYVMNIHRPVVEFGHNPSIPDSNHIHHSPTVGQVHRSVKVPPMGRASYNATCPAYLFVQIVRGSHAREYQAFLAEHAHLEDQFHRITASYAAHPHGNTTPSMVSPANITFPPVNVILKRPDTPSTNLTNPAYNRSTSRPEVQSSGSVNLVPDSQIEAAIERVNISRTSPITSMDITVPDVPTTSTTTQMDLVAPPFISTASPKPCCFIHRPSVVYSITPALKSWNQPAMYPI
ncbi:hypothetical protein BDM02DRAFT_3188570 [Thelephora ganbajun]|uniref:Uncharacterized protein n=1 Tax=Thelephora ganbajun TaxID=370292 RepID=A0ACB6ZC39_THEGA|nr:hypothetical protein BDM02DRAFT_3188570 [Thelephora ganbajun]